MAKIKSRTFTEEFDEQGDLISEWESKEYYPEPKDAEFETVNIFKDYSGMATGGIVPNVNLGIPTSGCTITNCYYGSLRS